MSTHRLAIFVIFVILLVGLGTGCKDGSPGTGGDGGGLDAGVLDAGGQADAEVPPGPFLIEDVSELDANVFLPNIAILSGSPVIYYTNWTTNREVWRAERNGGGWNRSLLVADTGFDIADLAAGIDAGDGEHVVAAPYYGEGLALLYVGSAGAWSPDDVLLDHASYSAVDAANHSLGTGPGLSSALVFYAHDDTQLIYAWRTATTGPWSLYLTPAFTQVLATAVALDATGVAHVAYVQVINNQRYPYYAHWDAGAMNFVENQETFDFQNDPDPDVGSGFGFGLRVDVPFFVLADRKTGELVYFERLDWYSWSREVIDAGADTGGRSTISAGAAQNGDIHVAYIDENRGALRYAVRSAGIWTTETVHTADPAGAPYQHVRLVVDANGIPHLTYLDTRDRVIRHATPAP